jgi:integrase/recombinase XerD
VDTTAAIDRFLQHGGLAPATRRAYRSDLKAFADWLEARGHALEEADARVVSEWVGELGSGRGRLSSATISRRLAAVRSFLRFSLGPDRVPEAAVGPRRSRRLPDAPKESEIGEILELAEGDSPLARRNRALLELLYSAGLRSAEAVGLDLADVDFEREALHVRGKGGKDRVVPLGEEAAHQLALYLRDARPQLARGAVDAFFLSARARHEHRAAPAPPPAPPPACLRHAPPRGRRRPADDPGAARPRVPLDHADLQPRRREAPTQGLRPLPSAQLVRKFGID